MSTKNKKASPVENGSRRPEKRVGPFHHGLGIAIWLNRVETLEGPRFFRSITFNARRYREKKSGEWRDAASFRSVDLATLELAIAHARMYIASTPLPGQPLEDDESPELFREEMAETAAS